MSDLAFAPASRLVAALAAGEVSSSELLDLYLDRVERHDPRLGAVVALDAERARAAARAADEQRARGERTGPLHGLPVTVKECVEATGMRTTCGAPALAHHLSDHDADAVARLRAAGAVVFGKTNLPIWCSEGQSFNELYGTTSDPWDLSRAPGGSSGGSAAALAAGLTGLELGSDIAGSIRTSGPAAPTCAPSSSTARRGPTGTSSPGPGSPTCSACPRRPCRSGARARRDCRSASRSSVHTSRTAP